MSVRAVRAEQGNL